MIVLGIDPGYAIVGCGVVEYQSNRFRLLTYGAIITEAHTPFNERIEKIYDEADELMKRFHPEAMAIEKLFFLHQSKDGYRRCPGEGGARARRSEEQDTDI